MDKTLMEKYEKEMLEMSKRAVLPAIEQDDGELHTGKLSVFVTTARGLAGIEGADVTVFTGDINDRTVVDTAVTDKSGQTKEFVLPTKSKALSETQSENKKPFMTYGIYVQADGYVNQANLNIPIFEGVTSIQSVNLISVEANNDSETPIVIDEAPNFGL